MPEIPCVGADSSTDDLLAGLDAAGIVVVEGLLGRDGIEAVTADLAPWLERAEVDQRMVNPGAELFFAGVRNVTGLTAKSPAFVDRLLLSPLLLSLADHWFASVASSYQLNIAHLLVRDPGAQLQLVHRDEEVWGHLQQLLLGADPHPEVQLACVTALVDFTAEIGATVVVPGSHRWERGRQPLPEDLVPAEMPAGSTAVYRGSLLHGGGANITDRPRAAIHHSYVAGWLRTEESGLLATPPHIARGLPRRAQELVGYQAHDAIQELGGYLGVVDLQNPVDLLTEGALDER